MKALIVDFSCTFHDKQWVYSLMPVLANRGIECRYMNFRSRSSVTTAAKAEADLVLYSSFAYQLGDVARFDRELKSRVKCRSLMGGSGPTFNWTCHNGSTIDAICIGEGELALGDFLDSGMAGGRNIIPNGQDRPAQLAPLVTMDEMPFPDRRLVYQADSLLREQTAKQFMSGRGCPYECTYCFNHAYNRMFKECGPVVRKKSVDYLLDEIRHVRRQWPLSTVAFSDDTFIVDKKWLMEFARRYPAEIGLPFTCNLRANLMDDDVARALKESGCALASWSVEAGNDRLRNEVLRRNMSREQILACGELLYKHGVKQRLTNIFGIPGESRADVEETVKMNIAVHPVLATANIFVPYPGLRLTEHALATGCLSPENAAHLPKDFFTKTILNFPPSHNRYLRKTISLIVLFTRWPWTYRKAWMRRFLYALPQIVSKTLADAIFLVVCRKLYRIGVSWRMRLAIVWRHVWNQVWNA